MRRRRLLIALLVVGAAAYYAGLVHTPPGPRSIRAFEPDRQADLEVAMWRAYYAKERVELFRLLVVSLREQNRYSWAKAIQAGFHLARAASQFADMRSDYERVLPDLERAYTIAKSWTGAGFDPAAVARAELSWWVARRVPGENSPERIGGLIADENALLFEVPRDRVLEASLRRAQAAALRDAGGVNADWSAVAELLRQSYRQLHASVH
jgi:hypothetical protein